MTCYVQYFFFCFKICLWNIYIKASISDERARNARSNNIFYLGLFTYIENMHIVQLLSFFFSFIKRWPWKHKLIKSIFSNFGKTCGPKSWFFENIYCSDPNKLAILVYFLQGQLWIKRPIKQRYKVHLFPCRSETQIFNIIFF